MTPGRRCRFCGEPLPGEHNPECSEWKPYEPHELTYAAPELQPALRAVRRWWTA